MVEHTSGRASDIESSVLNKFHYLLNLLTQSLALEIGHSFLLLLTTFILVLTKTYHSKSPGRWDILWKDPTIYFWLCSPAFEVSLSEI